MVDREATNHMSVQVGLLFKNVAAGCVMHARRETDTYKFSLLTQLTISIPTNFAHFHVLEHFRKLFIFLNHDVLYQRFPVFPRARSLS
jgi:hypothetical protein